MELVGKTKEGKNVFKFVFGADTKNGYYIKGNDYDNGAVPEVITKIK